MSNETSARNACLKVVTLGAGAMGSYFAGCIAEHGGSIILVDVDKARLDAIAQAGLRIDDGNGDRRVTVPTSTASDLSGSIDLVIVFTKGMHTGNAVESVRHVVTENTWFLTLQNGLGNPERIASLYPDNPVALGVTDLPVDLLGPGHIRSKGAGSISLGSLTGDAQNGLEKIRTLLADAGFDCVIETRIMAAIWEKVSFNAALNPLTALTRLSVGGLNTSDGRRLIEEIVAESVKTAAAAGVEVDHQRILSKIDYALTHHGGHAPSMLQDLLAHRETEIETINGAIMRAAKAHDVAAPLNSTLTHLIRLAQRATSTR